jgi:hypothetical protein
MPQRNRDGKAKAIRRAKDAARGIVNLYDDDDHQVVHKDWVNNRGIQGNGFKRKTKRSKRKSNTKKSKRKVMKSKRKTKKSKRKVMKSKRKTKKTKKSKRKTKKAKKSKRKTKRSQK